MTEPDQPPSPPAPPEEEKTPADDETEQEEIPEEVQEEVQEAVASEDEPETGVQTRRGPLSRCRHADLHRNVESAFTPHRQT